ncbi:MAG TPA: flippase-like domain-containing protein [Geminicoccaceae bacterium]
MRSTGTEAAAISDRSVRAPLLGACAWLVGLGLIAGLIGAQDLHQVGAALALAGWSMILIGVVHLGVLLADTLGWRALLQRSERPSFKAMVVHRWIGSSVNGLLPAAQVGGEIVRAHLLSRAGVAGPIAGASVVVDLTTGLATQLAFVLLGIGLLLEAEGGGRWVLHLGAGLGVLGLLVVGFGLLQRGGLFLRLARMVERATRARAWEGLIGSAAALDREVIACYRDRLRLSMCAGWRLVGWLWGSAEIWLAFWLLGHPISVAEAVVLESLGQAVRSVGFVLPGGLGAQESAIVAAGMLVGIAPDLALAVALIKRARELTYGVSGLIAWSMVDVAGRRA